MLHFCRRDRDRLFILTRHVVTYQMKILRDCCLELSFVCNDGRLGKEGDGGCRL